MTPGRPNGSSAAYGSAGDGVGGSRTQQSAGGGQDNATNQLSVFNGTWS